MSEIADLVPQEGFLADYVAYARRHAMAPDQFHLACGLGALSAIAGSALWFPMGISRYYGTFWGVLCGPAGRARKTSAMKLAMDLVDSVIPELQLPSDFSREALLQLLEKQPSGVMMIDEFGGFLARASRDYMSGVKQDLSKMWDSPGVLARATMKAKYRIERPTLTIMAACPLEDFTNFARFSDFKQGFISRLLFFTMGQEDDLTYIDPGDVDQIAREYLIVQLREFAKLRANPKPIVVSEAIRQQWREYDEKAAIEAAEAPPELSGWESRRGIWIAKLGLLFSLARTGDPVMDEEELARADWLVEILTRSMRELVLDVPLAGDRGAEKRRLIADRAKALARANQGVVLRRDLLRSVQRHVDSVGELDRVMGVLIEAGEYETGRRKTGERGFPAQGWRYLNGKPAPSDWSSDSRKGVTESRQQVVTVSESGDN
jgi:hypothetical protein